MATISEVLKIKSEDEEEPKKKSREDWRKAKELEEARKAGTAPAAVDEEGKDINPHIPQYISSAPWYYGTAGGPTLKHQRVPDKPQEYSSLNEWYKRGVNTESISTKFRKGACENCGAMTHTKKDCFERPRKIGAAYNNMNIAPDEHVQPVLNQDFDGKRDRWAGYDPAQHKTIIEQYQKIEEAKRELRAQKLNDDEKEGNSSAGEDDEDKYVDDFDMPGTKVDSKQRITVRNLRIREDTAKYLRNLDLSSAYYDPKTRAMRDNPHKPGEDPDQVEYAGENFVRYSGDTTKHAQAQLFAWEAYERGVDVHLLAEPTKLEQLKKEYETHKDRFKKKTENTVLAKYGGEEHMQTPPIQLLLAQTEEYVEYSRRGDVIKGENKGVVRSRYEEDVYPTNHLSVWGSFWESGEWGYKCCRSLVQNSYCTGKAGIELSKIIPELGKIVPIVENHIPKLNDSENKLSSIDLSSQPSASNSSSTASESERKKSKEKHKKNKKDKKKKSKKEMKDVLKKALEKEEERLKEVDRIMKMDERKRPYNSMYEVSKPTEEEIEAYHMKKRRDDDPMANFV
ncbi:pre-mRNA-splicing factor SLU7 [Daktulosphaira vitifoliae]|uniref:pre-mRNA-splicing factor SLU7 n=1 Tax=Daktulosphaira vitifoliae TaxID=58002 RepID=UPI0021A9FADD|nr:pre-mRNA-splicing factor SLU7 [Daktulosphaira vitifoliae]